MNRAHQTAPAVLAVDASACKGDVTEPGVLVGLRMANDTPAFCASTSNTLEIGSLEECPPSSETLLMSCNPVEDGGYFSDRPGLQNHRAERTGE